MAPQGATRIKKSLPYVCPTGMELGGALRNTEIFFLNIHIVGYYSGGRFLDSVSWAVRDYGFHICA
jgi:hypothetical protein